MLYCSNFKEGIYSLNGSGKKGEISLLMHLLILTNSIYIVELLIRLLIAANSL